MSLTFVDRFEMYSIYTDYSGYGVLHYIPHRNHKIDFDQEEANFLFRRLTRNMRMSDRRDFRDKFVEMLRGVLLDPEIADDIFWCGDCRAICLGVDGVHDISGRSICDSCIENYSICDDCSDYSANTSYTLHDEYVCESCRDDNYSYCDECDGWHHNNSAEEHEHDGSGCCESPALEFTIRNDGDPALAQDTRVTVALPAGTISDEGINQICILLQNNGLYDSACATDMIGSQWQTREGNFTKRLSRTAFNKYAERIPPAVLSSVGCIARDNSTPVDFAIEVTRNLNLPARDFGHAESCWWQSYSEGRCALKSNGGFGMRTFENDCVTGRAWVLPLKLDNDKELPERKLVPTFDTVKADAFMVFNGYGKLGGYAPARIMSHMAGMTYRKVTFYGNPMYVNNDSGYLVAPEEIASKYTDGSVEVDLSQHSSLYAREMSTLYAAEKEMVASV